MINPAIAQHLDIEGGFHVNITEASMTPELEAYRVHPETPQCVFMGDPCDPFTTIFLQFADEDAARSAAPHLFVD